MSGIFGVVSKGDCVSTLLYGTDYHSHLGTEYGGLAVLGEEGFSRHIHNISQSQFKSKFFEDSRSMKGSKGIGVISAYEEQPIYVNSKFGPFCIVTNGLITNAELLARGLMDKGVSFSEMTHGHVNPTEIVAKLIVEASSIVEGIEHMFERIKGSCCLLILHRDGIYAARDKNAFSPLCLGKSDDAVAVTTETCAFPNTGFKAIKSLGPGEIVLIDEEGVSFKRAGGGSYRICAFLWIYTGFPASQYEGVTAEIVRERCGRFLAKADTDIHPHLVAGVPDSGVGHAIGYSMESHIPYRRPLVKYTPGYGRSYTPPSQDKRDLIAKMKLIAIEDVIRDKSIVLCEDSIVRGTQLKNFAIRKLWDAGAREVHVRPACPPLMFPCIFNLSTRTIHELVARRAIKDIESRDIEDVGEYVDNTTEKHRAMVDWIARDINVTTLRYQTLDNMVTSIGVPREKLCLYCWTGVCGDGSVSAGASAKASGMSCPCRADEKQEAVP